MALRTLFPDVQPHASGFLDVDPPHRIYWEQSGNPDGKPALVLHGGPGSGTSPRMRRFFDPAHWRIVMFDQRGCGRSTPHAELAGNSTWELVADMECLRRRLGIERWMVFGGSWGSTLALAYAQAHPGRVAALVLRGIFLLRRWELEWFYQDGCSAIFPDLWEHYLAPIPPAERGDLISAYHRRLTGSDPAVRLEAARAWSLWEARTSFLREDPDYVSAFDSEARVLAFASIE
jgi:proline iminopeptidase